MSKPSQRSPEPPRFHAGCGPCPCRIGQLPSSPATADAERNDPANHQYGAAPIASAILSCHPVPRCPIQLAKAQVEVRFTCLDAPSGSGQSHNNCGTERRHASPIRTPQSDARCAISDLRVMSRNDTVQWRAFACATVPLSREFADLTV